MYWRWGSGLGACGQLHMTSLIYPRDKGVAYIWLLHVCSKEWKFMFAIILSHCVVNYWLPHNAATASFIWRLML